MLGRTYLIQLQRQEIPAAVFCVYRPNLGIASKILWNLPETGRIQPPFLPKITIERLCQVWYGGVAF